MNAEHVDNLKTGLIGWAERRAGCTGISRQEENDLRRVEDVIHFAQSMTPVEPRKNGDPAFSHPLIVAHFQVSVIDKCERDGAPPFKYAAALIIAALCHDLLEDTRMPLAQLRNFISRNVEGDRAGGAVFNVSKRYHDDNGALVEKTDMENWRDVLSDALSFMLKCGDRWHNIVTMYGNGAGQEPAYDRPKQEQKLGEVARILLPAGRTGGSYPADQRPYVVEACRMLARVSAQPCAQLALDAYSRTLPRIFERAAASPGADRKPETARTPNSQARLVIQKAAGYFGL